MAILSSVSCERASLLYLYRDDFQGFREFPDAWGKSERSSWPEDVARVTELLKDKGENSEYSLILERLEEDVAALTADPNAPKRLLHDPHRILQATKDIGIPSDRFPDTEIQSTSFTRFITEDEIDAYLTRGGGVSESKMRILSYFLHDHTPNERVKFLKNEYGHSGGTLRETNGWYDITPSKGVKLSRGSIMSPDVETTLSWSTVAKRIGQLISEGRYMNRAELDRVPDYERIILARQINNFYYNLDEYDSPFPKELDFHYPKEDEWAALTAFLNDAERIGDVLAEMEHVFANTAEEDRYYNTRKAGFESLSAFSAGIYTLFPGLESLPGPEIHAQARRPQAPVIDKPIEDVVQLSFFDSGNKPELIAETPLPVLPSVEEQRNKIQQTNEQAAGVDAPAADIYTEIDAALLDISDADKTRIAAQFADNPRSREAVELVREIYGSNLPTSQGQAMKRITELVQAGQFSVSAVPAQSIPEQAELDSAATTEELGTLRYAVGDMVYLDGGKLYVIENITHRVSLNLAPGQESAGVPDRQSMPVGNFEKAVREDSRNNPLFSEQAQSAITGIEANTTDEAVQHTQTATAMVELDFDAAAQNVLDRIMADGDYSDALANAGSRGALRSPLNTSLDRIIGELEQDEPQIYHSYHTDDDWADRLFDYVYRQSWQMRQQPTAVAPPEQAPELLAEHQGFTEIADPDEIAAVKALFGDDEPQAKYISGQRVVLDMRKKFRDSFVGEYTIGDVSANGVRVNATYTNSAGEEAQFAAALAHRELEHYTARPVMEKLHEELTPSDQGSATAYYLLRYPDGVDASAVLIHETLSLIKEPSDRYVICADSCNLSQSEMEQWNITFRKMPRDWHLLPDAVQEHIRALGLEYEKDAPRYSIRPVTHAEQISSNSLVVDLIGKDEQSVRYGIYDNETKRSLKTDDDRYITFDTEEEAEVYIARLVAGLVQNPLDDKAKPLTLVEVETELDRKAGLMRDYPYYDKVEEAFGYLKTWRTMPHRVGITASALVDQINAMSDPQTVEWLSQVPWDNWRKALDVGDFEPLSTETREEEKASRQNFHITDFTTEYKDRIQFYQRGDYYVYDVVGERAAALATALDIPTTLHDAGYAIENICQFPASELDRYLEKFKSFGISIALRHGLADEDVTFHDFNTPEISSNSTVESDVSQKQKAANFRITDNNLGEGGAKTKFRANIAALQTLKTIEQESRTATPDEQEILSRYVGWGGIPQAFDPDNKQWEKEYLELYALLSPEEFQSARASTLNAHYTSPTVIRAIYETVERMGFKTGNILEPSCGVGNFFGLLPESMQGSKLYGVELDSVTARIAKHLYPNADIKETGFEKTDTPDAFFDLAIGNVPFGDYGVADKRYDKHKFRIHDYFFAKTLDQVRPGGVVAFITSKGTLDKQNPEVRKYIAQRAELLGAVRLPNNAFLKNAGTEVTSDIIFLQKRDRPIDIEPDWVHLGETEDGMPVNRYFADNPEMVLGKMGVPESGKMYGDATATAYLPIEGADLAEQLKTALSFIDSEFTNQEIDDIEGIDNETIPADPNVKNFSYALVTPSGTDGNENSIANVLDAGRVYFRENSMMYPVDLPATTLERIKGMIALRDCTHQLIALQLDERSDSEIQAKQAELNTLYDRFTAEFGVISSSANSKAFNADSAYYLLCSLEILDEDGNLERKADMFTKRTIKPKVTITHVDTSSEALAVSLGERAFVDLEFMGKLTGFTQEKLIADLEGVIFLNTGNARSQKEAYVTADEFLSGDIRVKLDRAKAAATVLPELEVNVRALEAAMPKDLDASEISVRLGSTWIGPEYVQQFMHELLGTSQRMQDTYQVKYHALTGEWQVTGKGRASYSDIAATVTYGTERMNAYQIISDTLNLRDVRVYDYDSDGKRTLNKKETTLAQQKQEVIKQAFKEWIWNAPERRHTLVRKYNDLYNSTRPRDYDGSHIQFVGMNPEVNLRKHQIDSVARQMYGGNSLLAHVVGAGKTFSMIAAAMESKRLGLCHKSLFTVPNHLTEQWGAEFLRLYPNANILVATKKDFEMRNRKKFCAKIATGDYDAVIIGHSQLEKIPMSRERQERLLNEQISEVENGINDLVAEGAERYTIKQMEKTLKSLETRLARLFEGKKRDDVVTFEQLGVDKLFVDESHFFKNLFLYTKMRNVAGLSTSEAQKSSDLFMKCRYMDEETGGRGVIFATGTPVSNSMTELYTVQRYLQYDTLVAKGIAHFDAWASTFGETQTSIELAPEGTGYRARTRFSRFHNLPELMSMLRDVADIQTADMLNLPVPEAKFETVVVEPSELQKGMVQELSERAAAVQARRVDPSTDNMLKITTDGRKIGLDQRLIDPLLPDFEGSKVNACVDAVFQTWEETKSKKLTQLVFSDFSTPNKDGRFNIYDDIRAKLIERGIPEHEIAFIHDAGTEAKKKELFAKVRQGRVRVLLGSTFKMGAGTNVQDRLYALHDVDCPWRPADLEQRSGRIIRQGNMNPEVKIKRYVTNGTFDAYLWQTVENKQKFIAQIMSSKSPVRSCEDVDETALSYAEIKALCAGNPLIAEKMNLDNDVAKLRLLKADYINQRHRLEDDLLKSYPEQVTAQSAIIEGITKDIAVYAAHKEKTADVQPSLPGGAVAATAKFPGMTINGVEYVEKEPAAKALLESCKGIVDRDALPIGHYMGFDMSIRKDSYFGQGDMIKLTLRSNMSYQIELSTDAFGNITRINNALADLPKRLAGAHSQLENIQYQQTAAKQELEKPFTLAGELAEKEARLALLNAELNIDGDGGLDVVNDTDGREEEEAEPMPGEERRGEYVGARVSAKSRGPSILDDLRSFDVSRLPTVPKQGMRSTEHRI